ncbi:hypothetical protein NG99_16985 [Erwinia typographi]|uniref:Uncharacterized protein n=1 Tax=Erwinia typographi TaxID=371042 RepID=A0A0A3Z0V1_9GAMM|nr:hypothetical protein NG99_16985 [Erwinia typographi]
MMFLRIKSSGSIQHLPQVDYLPLIPVSYRVLAAVRELTRFADGAGNVIGVISTSKAGDTIQADFRRSTFRA